MSKPRGFIQNFVKHSHCFNIFQLMTAADPFYFIIEFPWYLVDSSFIHMTHHLLIHSSSWHRFLAIMQPLNDLQQIFNWHISTLQLLSLRLINVKTTTWIFFWPRFMHFLCFGHKILDRFGIECTVFKQWLKSPKCLLLILWVRFRVNSITLQCLFFRYGVCLLA